MIKNTFLAICLLASTSVWAQTFPFNYDFGDTPASFAPNPGASSTKFLPKILGSVKSVKPVVRIRTASDGSGEFNLVKNGAAFIKGSGLEVIAGTTTSKLSMYDLEFKAITKTSFDLKFDGSKSGQWIFANGNSNSEEDAFQGNSGIKDTNSELFSGLRWVLTDANELSFYVREEVKWVKVKTHPFIKDQEFHIDIISNNSGTEKNGIAANSYQIMVNGNKIGAYFKTGGLETNAKLNGLLFLGYKPKESTEKPKVWIDNLVITEVL
ncbi:hypothetical protein [Pedobacter alpinus]|uniref:Uncharacterized protein n=1 Tax=Pedobacter alpinus TaxID=1590643 RepID=A0ABW5TWG7_9SPHI